MPDDSRERQRRLQQISEQVELSIRIQEATGIPADIGMPFCMIFDTEKDLLVSNDVMNVLYGMFQVYMQTLPPDRLMYYVKKKFTDAQLFKMFLNVLQVTDNLQAGEMGDIIIFVPDTTIQCAFHSEELGMYN